MRVLLRYILVDFVHFMSQSTKKRKIRQIIWISLILSTRPCRTDCSMQNCAFQRLWMYYQWKFLWKFTDLSESENAGETFVIAISCSASYMFFSIFYQSLFCFSLLNLLFLNCRPIGWLWKMTLIPKVWFHLVDLTPSFAWETPSPIFLTGASHSIN